MKPDNQAASWASASNPSALSAGNLFAAGDLMLAACQRSVALQASLVDDMVRQSLAHSHELSSGKLRPDWPRAFYQESLMEPSLRYVTNLMALGRTTTSCLMSLGTAQLRGATEEVDSLSRGAHDDAVEAAQDAAAATTAALSHCLEAVGKIGEIAARAGAAAMANGMASFDQARDQQSSYMRDTSATDEEDAQEAALDSADAEEMTEPIVARGRHPRVARSVPRGRGH